MLGLDHLTDIRRRRMQPKAGVLVTVTRKPSLLQPQYVEWLNSQSPGASLVADAGLAFDRMDLRAMVGLRVLVTAPADEPEQRSVRALCVACVAAGADEVIGVQEQAYPAEAEWFKGERLPNRGALVFHHTAGAAHG